MHVGKLEDMVRGWFVGNFNPSCYKTEECEVAVQEYEKGSKEKAHFHKVATEITLILSGEVKMNDKTYKSGDILRIEPGKVTDFEAIIDAVTVVVKVPGVTNDKYLVEPPNRGECKC